MMLPSASRLDLAHHCSYPWSSGARWPKSEPTAAMLFGRAFADLSEACVPPLYPTEDYPAEEPDVEKIAAEHSLSPSETKRLTRCVAPILRCLSADAASWAVAEDAFSYSPATGKVTKLGRAARGPWGELFGRADLVSFREAARVQLVVRDFKTGTSMRGQAPDETRQLRALGLMAARHYGARSVRVELALVDPDEEEIEIHGADLGPFDLGVIEAELAEVVERLQAPPTPVPGPWCGRCPMASACPATKAALAQVHADLTEFPLFGELKSAEHAANNRHRLAVIRELCDQREAAIRDYAKREPLPVEGKPGTFWGPVERNGAERIEVTDALVALLAEEGISAPIERSLSKGDLEHAIKESLGPDAKRGAAGRRIAGIFERMRAAGMTKRSSKYYAFETFNKKEEPCAQAGNGQQGNE